MDIKKLKTIENTKSILDNEKIFYTEFPNGHLKVDKVNYWCTSAKWYDENLRIGNIGFNSFLKHLRDNNII